MASRTSSAGLKYLSEYFKSEVWFFKKSDIQCFTLYVIYIIARCQDNSAPEDKSVLEVVVDFFYPDFFFCGQVSQLYKGIIGYR